MLDGAVVVAKIPEAIPGLFLLPLYVFMTEPASELARERENWDVGSSKGEEGGNLALLSLLSSLSLFHCWASSWRREGGMKENCFLYSAILLCFFFHSGVEGTVDLEPSVPTDRYPVHYVFIGGRRCNSSPHTNICKANLGRKNTVCFSSSSSNYWRFWENMCAAFRMKLLP